VIPGPQTCVIGFGELGSTLALGLIAAGVPNVRVVSRPRPEAEARTLASRIRATGAQPYDDLAAALSGARLAISAVPAAAAAEVSRRSAEFLEPGALFVDLTPDHPDRKAAAAELVGRHEGHYVDAAVLGTVIASGFGVPMLASGPGAADWAILAGSLGMSVDAIEGPAGLASTVKLLRSVYMKGRDALVAETMLAARRYGVEAELLPTIAGPGEEVPFPELVERVLCSLALHAGRRADELELSADLLRAVGVEPLVTSGASRRLRSIAALQLRDEFSGKRPRDRAAVLDAIERLAPATPERSAAAWPNRTSP
jgi:3-hydroxyisobutyrate dehydrogenase-like beta-hydroxyacid dehydrogenase